MPSVIHSLSLRSIWLKLHLWLALLAGFFFVLIGLTGSLSVYHQDIDEWLNPQLVIEQPVGEWQSLDRIMDSVRNAHPKRYGSWTLEMPRNPHSMMTAWYDKPRETYFELYAPLMVSINPYTAEVVTSRFWGQTFTTWVLDVHTQLLMNRFGWNTVGVFGVLLALSVSSGLYLWWPGYRSVISALKVSYPTKLIKFLFEIHKLTGVLIAPVLLLLALTGWLLSFPAVLEGWVGTSGMAHGETGRTIASTAIPNDHPTGLESAEFIARGAFPKGKLRRITTPVGETGVYRINLRQLGEVNERHPFTTVWVDRWSGQAKEARDPFRFTMGEQLITWIWPLHTGEALGAKARLLWFFTGFGLLFLYVSGVLRWLHKRGKIQDKAIDMAEYRRIGSLVLNKMVQGSWALLRAIYVGVKIALPYLVLAWAMSQRWLVRLWMVVVNRQKRLGKF